MNKVQVKLIVFFDGAFWVGLFEKKIGNNLEVAKFTFGSEPREIEVLNFILNDYKNLKFSMAVIDAKNEKVVNPKRMKRLVKREVLKSISTKSQQALKLEQENSKFIRHKKLKEKTDLSNKIKMEIKKKKRLKNIKEDRNHIVVF